MKKVVFISSTGGHLQELLGLAPIFEKYDYHIITEKTSSNANLRKEYGKRMHYLVYGTKLHLLSYLFIFSFNIIKSLYFLLRLSPDYIVTTGTHTAIPMCYLGKIFHKKIIYIETKASFTELSVSGRLMKNKADLFIVQHKGLVPLCPNAILCEDM